MRIALARVSDIEPGAWTWPHVNPSTEWADSQSGALVIETEFLDRFEALRVAFGRAIPINSGYRTPAHNDAISESGRDGPHTTGRAADLRVSGYEAFVIVQLAFQLGFTGIGIKQHGRHDGRFLHLDDLPQIPGRPRPWIWSY